MALVFSPASFFSWFATLISFLFLKSIELIKIGEPCPDVPISELGPVTLAVLSLKRVEHSTVIVIVFHAQVCLVAASRMRVADEEMVSLALGQWQLAAAVVERDTEAQSSPAAAASASARRWHGSAPRRLP